MVTVTSPQTVEQVLDIKGKSSDTKPVSMIGSYKIKNGSTFYEMDTGNLFMYDEDTNTWIAQ